MLAYRHYFDSSRFWDGGVLIIDYIYIDALDFSWLVYCHLLVQSYNGIEYAIVRGHDKYVYSMLDRSLIYYNLSADFYEMTPHLMLENITYEQFRGGYYCDRYKRTG